jgi:CBS domain-containing membrane protein
VQQDRNLELDFDASGRLARVCVALACSYTKDGGAPILSESCSSYEDFEREVARLKQELESALREARARFAGEKPPAAEVESVPSARTLVPASKSGARLVRDLMTREVRTLSPMDDLSVADELMKVGRFRHVVVVSEDGSVTGVVSQRDIFYDALAWSMGQGTHAHEKALQSTPAKEVMMSPVVSVASDAPLSEAAALLAEQKIGCLPVVDSGQLVGILTEGDLLSMLAGAGPPDS